MKTASCSRGQQRHRATRPGSPNMAAAPTTVVKMSVSLPQPPPSPAPPSGRPVGKRGSGHASAAARQQAKAEALLNEAARQSRGGVETPERTARRREEFAQLAAAPPGADDAPLESPRPDEPRQSVTNWRAWCREAAAVSQQYKTGVEVTASITGLQDDAMQIQLPDSSVDAKRMVSLKQELQAHAEQLAALAYEEMRGMMKVTDYRKVKRLLVTHERLAEANEKTRRQWTQLQDHRDKLIGIARTTVDDLTNREASVDVLEKQLARLEEFSTDLRAEFEKAREEVQMREDTARYELQKVVKDHMATIGDLSSMIDKWSEASSVVKERGSVQKRLDADIVTARAAMVSATACDDILVIDACIRQYARTCGDHLGGETMELVQRSEDLRDDLWERLATAADGVDEPDPMQLYLLIERSKDYGTDFDSPRRKATKRLQGMEQVAEAEIRAMIPSTEYAKIVAVQKKYEGWPAAINGALGMLENRREWLLSEAGSACKRTRISTDITVLHAALNTYADYHVDCPAYSSVRKQHDKQLAAAIANLRETTVDAAATIGDVETVLTRWNGVPGTEEAGVVLAERLARMTAPAEAELQGACGEPRLSDVDAVLQKFVRTGGPALLGSKAMLHLKRHRAQLCDDMRVQLRLGLAMEDALDIASLLETSEEYEQDLLSDRKALRLQRLKLARRAAELMEKLQSSKDFVSIENLLARYEGCPPEALAAREGLRKHRTNLIAKADKALAKAMDKDVPEIDATLQKYSEYGEVCQQCIAALSARREQRVREIRDELDRCATLVELKKWEGTYGSYKAISDIHEEMKTRFTSIVHEVTAECNAAASTKAYPEIKQTLDKHEPWAKHVDLAYKNLRRLCIQMVTSMAYDLKQCTAGLFPKPILAVVERSLPFGPSVAKPRTVAQARIKQLTQEATKAMQVMCKSKRYTDVLAMIAQYDQFADETQPTWEKLCTHKVGLITKARNAVFELVKETDPVVIDQVLAKYTGKDKDYPGYDYGNTVEDAIHAAMKRRAELIGTAVAEMQVVLKSAEVEGQDTIRDVLKKYQAYPADLTEQREMLKTKNKMLSMSTTDQIRTALRSHDLEVVDLCISFCLQQKVDGSLADLVKKLYVHRTRLVDHALAKLEKALKYKKPAEIDSTLAEAEPLFASSHFHDLLVQTEEEQMLGTLGDEATHVHHLREDVEKHRSKLIAGCVAKMEEILKDKVPKKLEKSLADLIAFKNVAECKPNYDEMETTLTEKQQLLREKVDGLLLLDSPHPNDIKSLLAERKTFGPSMAAEERLLSARLEKIVRSGNAQLFSLTTSDDYAAVRETVKLFSDYPDEFAENIKGLRSHQAGLLEKAMQEFKTMCKEAKHPNEIFRKGPGYYDVFLDEFNPAKELADVRVAQMVKQANTAMSTAQEGQTIWKMQATIDKYAEYPKQETEEARASLSSAIAKLGKHQSSLLLALCDSQDIPKIDTALAEKPFPLVVEAHNTLREYREKLEAVASKVCDEAMQATLPKDLDAAIEAATPFGRSLELKRSAIMKRRRAVIKDARTKMSKVDTNSFPLVELAVAEFDGFAIDTDAPWKMLVARKKELLEGCKEVLRQALKLRDPLQVDQLVERSLPFTGSAETERQAAMDHAMACCESACTTMKTVQGQLKRGECTLAAVELVVDKYSYLSAHPPVQGAYEDLVQEFKGACDDLDRIVTEAEASPDIVHCHDLIKLHSTGCRATKEMIAKLESHRADLTAEYQSRITKATAFVVDIDVLTSLLEEVAPHEKHIGSKSIAALKEYLNDLVAGNMRELTSMVKSEHFPKVCRVLEKYAGDEDKARVPVKIKEAIGKLRQRRADLIEKARATLKPLSEEQDPNVIDRVLKSHEPYGDTIEPELSHALKQRKDLIDDAIHDMLTAADDSTYKTLPPHGLTELLLSLHALFKQYAHFPGADMDSTRKVLRKHSDHVISACDDRMNQALTLTTFEESKEIEKMLSEFAPIKDDVEESFHLLDIHLNRIWKWDAKKFDRAALQPSDQEKEELLTVSIAKMARKQEEHVLKALEATYKLDQRNESKKIFHESTASKTLRNHMQGTQGDLKMRPSAALVRAGRQVQRELADNLYKGGSVYYSPGFDYHKLDWTLEDELAARFAAAQEDDAALDRPVTVEMSLAMDYDAAVADPSKRDAFMKDFVADMAKSLGCDPSLLQVDDLFKGSVIVKFTLKAAPSGDGPSPVALGAKLNTMMQDPSSALAKSKLLNKVNRTKGLLVAAKPLPKTKVLQLNTKKGMVNSREFSLELYISKFRAETRLSQLQLREGNSGLVASVDSTWEQLTAIEAEHERLYNDLMELHNELQWIEQPFLWQKIEDEKEYLARRLENQATELPKVVMRSGMSDGDGMWSFTDWMHNTDVGGTAGGSIAPAQTGAKQKVAPVPPNRGLRARRSSAPTRRVSQLRDGALSSNPAPEVDVRGSEEEKAAALKIQSFVRGKKARLRFLGEVEQAQKAAYVRKQLAEQHGVELEQLPTKLEIGDACRELGIDPHHAADKELVWLAEEYLLAPLPKGWTEMYLAKYKAVVYITAQGKSSWAHPSKGYYIGLVRELRRLRADYMFVAKDGLFAVAKVGAKIDAVLKTHADEQKRTLAAEAEQLAGAEWTQAVHVVDGDFAGKHLSNTVKKQRAQANAYDPRRVTMQKIKDKRRKLKTLEGKRDTASKDIIQNLEIEIAVLEEDLKAENRAASRSIGEQEVSKASLGSSAPSAADDEALAVDDALASLPSLPLSSDAQQ